MRTHAKISDRKGTLFVSCLWEKHQTNGFHEIIVLYFVAIGSFTVDGCLLQPTGGEKTTPQKTRFRSVRMYKIDKEFTYK